jgi:hypothetical protein
VFKRRIKTQTVLQSADTAAMLFLALLTSGQINMRRVDGWQKLATKPIDQSIDPAARLGTLQVPEITQFQHNRDGTQLEEQTLNQQILRGIQRAGYIILQTADYHERDQRTRERFARGRADLAQVRAEVNQLRSEHTQAQAELASAQADLAQDGLRLSTYRVSTRR